MAMRESVNRKRMCFLLLYGGFTAALIEWISYVLLSVKFDLMGNRVYLAQLFLQDGTLAGIADSMYQVADFHIAYYFYIALYGLLTGQVQAENIYIQLQLIAFGVLFLFLPYCVARVFGSFRLAIISPVVFFLLIWQYFLHVYYTDYWGMGWAVFLSLPFFFLFLKKYRTQTTLWKIFLALCVLAGIVNIPRAHAGLGIITVVVVLMLYKIYCYVGGSIWQKVTQSVCVIILASVGYFLFTSMIPNAYLSSLGYDYATTATKTHKLGSWHTLYIGLGWDSPISISPKLSFMASENPYNIIFWDECAMEAVSRENHMPVGSTYVQVKEQFGYTEEAKKVLHGEFTEGYFDILKNLYFKAFEEHPLWFIGSYIKKFFVCGLMLFKDTFSYMFCVGLIYFMMRKKHQIRLGSIVGKELYGVLVGLSFLGLLPGLIAVPSHVYLLGSVAAIQSICFLIVLEILASTPFFRKDENIHG